MRLLDIARRFVDIAKRRLKDPYPTKLLKQTGEYDYDTERNWLSEQMRSYAITGQFRLAPIAENYTEETFEIRRQYPIFLREPTIKAALFSKVWSVVSSDLNVIPQDKTNPVDKQIAKFVKYALTTVEGGKRKIGEAVLLPGLLRGWSLSEKVWTTSDHPEWHGLWKLKAIRSKDTNYVFPEIDPFKNVTAFWASANNLNQRFDPRDFVFWTHQSLFESPLGISDLRAVYRAATLKEAAIKLRMIFLDKFTGPYLVGKFSDDARRKYLQSALKEARATGYIALDKNSEVEVLDLAARGTADFKQAIDDFDREILVGIRFAHLDMMEGQTNGARGNTTVHRSMSQLAEWALADSLCTVINTQIVPDLVYPNFGMHARLPEVTLGNLNPVDVKADLEVDEILTRIGVPLSISDLYERSGRTPPIDEADTLKPTPPPQSPMPGMNVLPFAEGSPPKACCPTT
jgi:hypothetical protein